MFFFCVFVFGSRSLSDWRYWEAEKKRTTEMDDQRTGGFRLRIDRSRSLRNANVNANVTQWVTSSLARMHRMRVMVEAVCGV